MNHHLPTKQDLDGTMADILEDRDPLGDENRAVPIRLIDEPDLEETWEAEEAELGDERDVVQEATDLSSNHRVLPPKDDVPEGMEDVIRGEDEEIEKRGEDLETGED